MPKIDYTNQV